MASLSKIKRDTKSAEEGVWVNNIIDDICIKVAAENNKKYVQEIQRLMKPYQRSYRSMGESFNPIFEDMQNKAASKYILLDWKNIQNDDGSSIAYSESAAYDLLKDPENLEFRKIVFDLAAESEVFRKEVAEDLGNKSI